MLDILNAIIGAILSALVAYGIARFQIRNAQKLDNKNKKEENEQNLLLLKQELNKNEDAINSISRTENLGSNLDQLRILLNSAISDSIWKQVRMIVQIDTESYSKLDEFYSHLELTKRIFEYIKNKDDADKYKEYITILNNKYKDAKLCMEDN